MPILAAARFSLRSLEFYISTCYAAQSRFQRDCGYHLVFKLWNSLFRRNGESTQHGVLPRKNRKGTKRIWYGFQKFLSRKVLWERN